MKEKYSHYEFQISHELIPVWASTGKTDKTVDGYVYKIFRERDYMGYEDDLESEEWYYTEQEARVAAEERIDLLESGDGQ
jgi:hypothetical protein